MASYETSSHHIFTIERFRDGDTVNGFLRCRCCGSISYCALRILKIESWEIKGPQKNKALQTAEALTTRFRGMSGPLLQRSIRYDRYGRVLADVIINGSALSLQLVELGYSWWGVQEPEPVGHEFPPRNIDEPA